MKSDIDKEIDINWYTKEKPGWYAFGITRSSPQSLDWVNQYHVVVEWILEHVEMPRRHARWIIHPEHAEFKFRHERDYLLFVLRWS